MSSERAPRKSPSRRARLRRSGGLLFLIVLIVAGAVAIGTHHVLASRDDDGAGPGALGLPPGATAVDPSLFANGSCLEFGPTAGKRHKTVFLDAGHGGLDPGAVGTTESGKTIYEANETLPVELDAAELLRAQGFTVVVSRTSASTVLRLGSRDVSEGVLSLTGAHNEVAARDICANQAHADLLVGIYFDASDSSATAGSLTVYDAARSFSASNRRFARLLQSTVLGDMNAQGWEIPNDGVETDAGYGSSNGSVADGGLAAKSAEYDHVMLIGPAMAGYFSTPSEMPGAVIEPLYITDPFEGSIAASAHDQLVMANGIASAVEKYFGAS
ncbi:MAG: N-acetylmuramoyl-L-alanine amidase family protein [Acidimicrobiales bacterium]